MDQVDFQAPSLEGRTTHTSSPGGEPKAADLFLLEQRVTDAFHFTLLTDRVVSDAIRQSEVLPVRAGFTAVMLSDEDVAIISFALAQTLGSVRALQADFQTAVEAIRP